MQLSRKHQVVSSDDTGHVSIYGGKLTDCLNVGDEVCEALMKMGLNLGYPHQKWYGEPSDDVRDEFMHQAHLMGLDDYTHPDSSEPLSSRFWRRYGQNAFSILESIRREPSMAEVLIEGAEYTRCEIWLTRRYEMVTRLEGFLRRRSRSNWSRDLKTSRMPTAFAKLVRYSLKRTPTKGFRSTSSSRTMTHRSKRALRRPRRER